MGLNCVEKRLDQGDEKTKEERTKRGKIIVGEHEKKAKGCIVEGEKYPLMTCVRDCLAPSQLPLLLD